MGLKWKGSLESRKSERLTVGVPSPALWPWTPATVSALYKRSGFAYILRNALK